jgi:hypothetical protein
MGENEWRVKSQHEAGRADYYSNPRRRLMDVIGAADGRSHRNTVWGQCQPVYNFFAFAKYKSFGSPMRPVARGDFLFFPIIP